MSERRTILDAHDYLLRCRDLERRGLAPRLVQGIREAGDLLILRAYERCSNEELRQISEAFDRANQTGPHPEDT